MQAFRAFSILAIGAGGSAHCGWCHSWADGPGYYKKAGRERLDEQASKQHFSKTSASAPALLEFLS